MQLFSVMNLMTDHVGVIQAWKHAVHWLLEGVVFVHHCKSKG